MTSHLLRALAVTSAKLGVITVAQASCNLGDVLLRHVLDIRELHGRLHLFQTKVRVAITGNSYIRQARSLAMPCSQMFSNRSSETISPFSTRTIYIALVECTP